MLSVLHACLCNFSYFPFLVFVLICSVHGHGLPFTFTHDKGWSEQFLDKGIIDTKKSLISGYGTV